MKRLVFVVAVMLLVAGPAVAAPLSPPDAAQRFLTAETIEESWFAPSFLQAVPFAQLAPIRAQLTAGLGKFEEMRPDGDHWIAVYEKGTIPTYVALDAEGRFTGLRFLNPIPRVTDLAAAVDAVRELPGKVSLLITRDGVEAAALNADEPLAVGSTFKLAVLAALRADIDAGRRKWSDVVALDGALKSLPSGMLQEWPDRSPLTLETLATLMISISDNTATDLLIRTVGRDAVEKAGGARNRPFLTTREAFQLKAPDEAALRKPWSGGTEAERRAALAKLGDAPLPPPSLFGADPVAPEVEWFFTARELCALMDRVDDLDLMTVNPGVADPRHWNRVAYKGGSEPGVLNFTTSLVNADGGAVCVTLTWNNDATLDETRLASVYSGILEALRAQE